MSEKRKPCITFLLKKQGKTNKVEVFPAELFEKREYVRYADRGRVYRIRVNGKWFPKGEVRYFFKRQIMGLISKSIKFN